MPAPIDLSQIPARSSPTPKGAFRGGRGKGTGTVVDEYARKVMWVAFVASLLLLGYLLAGMYSGTWAAAMLHDLRKTHPADYQRQMDNIGLVSGLLRLTVLVYIVSLLIVTFRDETVGYVLLAVGLIFYAGLPFLTSVVYNWRSLKPSPATKLILQDFQMLAWAFFVPGLIWTIVDLIRRFRSAAEAAAIQRANLKYGANVKKQPQVKHRPKGVFSRCWELPYCRDNIREKCPVYIKRRGPCWWYKEGCMCEERIILQAVINTDWKEKAARADMSYNFGQQRAHMTMAAKRQRCRNCVIFNEHQRQKYKAMVAVTLILLPVLLYLNADALQGWTIGLLSGLDKIMKQFTLGIRSNTPSLDVAHAGVVYWTLIVALCIIVTAQVLKFIEFLCFKLKI